MRLCIYTVDSTLLPWPTCETLCRPKVQFQIPGEREKELTNPKELLTSILKYIRELREWLGERQN